MRVVKTLVLLIVCGSTISVIWLLHWMSVQSAIRVVRPDGAWMAVDQAGLARLNTMYAASPECRKRLSEPNRDPHLVIGCIRPQVRIDPAPQSDLSGLVPIQGSVQAIGISRAFLLPGGRLVTPFAASHYQMQESGIVEVERIRLDGTGREGWVETHAVGKVCCGL